MTFECTRVYKDGTVVEKTFTTQQEVDAWVKSNVVYRFGCALFINGRCTYEGYLTPAEIKKHEINP